MCYQNKVLLFFFVNARWVGIVNDVRVILPFVVADADVHARCHKARLGVQLIFGRVIRTFVESDDCLFEPLVVEEYDTFAPELDTFLAQYLIVKGI